MALDYIGLLCLGIFGLSSKIEIVKRQEIVV